MNTGQLNDNSSHGHPFYFHPPNPKVWQESLKELCRIREGAFVEQLGREREVNVKQSHSVR